MALAFSVGAAGPASGSVLFGILDSGSAPVNIPASLTSRPNESLRYEARRHVRDESENIETSVFVSAATR